MERKSEIIRKTNETEIKTVFNADGNGNGNIQTGIGFFDHMLNLFAKHGLFDLELKAVGDLRVDSHHTVEDAGIVLGQAINEALGTKAGITRYGSAIIPMDETLVLCALDLSGRPYLNFDVKITPEKLGDMDTETIEEFFRALAVASGMNLHIKLLDGKNGHHIAEGIFKAFARALDIASSKDPRVTGVPSTKGTL